MLAVDDEPFAMDIRLERPIRPPLGEADVVSENRGLTADLALPGHRGTPFQRPGDRDGLIQLRGSDRVRTRRRADRLNRRVFDRVCYHLFAILSNTALRASLIHTQSAPPTFESVKLGLGTGPTLTFRR
jgi:hypothetical protein